MEQMEVGREERQGRGSAWRRFFAKDTVAVGLAAGLGSEAGLAAALTAALLVAGESPAEHVRWYGGMFLAVLLVLRHYAKRKEQLTVTKTIIVVLFVTFLAFMAYLLWSHTLVIE